MSQLWNLIVKAVAVCVRDGPKIECTLLLKSIAAALRIFATTNAYSTRDRARSISSRSSFAATRRRSKILTTTRRRICFSCTSSIEVQFCGVLHRLSLLRQKIFPANFFIDFGRFFRQCLDISELWGSKIVPLFLDKKLPPNRRRPST